jgi:hypothetical protein
LSLQNARALALALPALVLTATTIELLTALVVAGLVGEAGGSALVILAAWGWLRLYASRWRTMQAILARQAVRQGALAALLAVSVGGCAPQGRWVEGNPADAVTMFRQMPPPGAGDCRSEAVRDWRAARAMGLHAWIETVRLQDGRTHDLVLLDNGLAFGSGAWAVGNTPIVKGDGQQIWLWSSRPDDAGPDEDPL